jgi:hypothetical protein
MLKIPKRHSHFFYGAVQSALTCAVASIIANISFIADGNFMSHWSRLWLFSWLTMLPVVLLAAPVIRRITDRFTGDI